ncbi:MAG: MFS transporter [Acidobacteriota bacterium]
MSRGVGQGALVVDLALFLHALGRSGAAIGGVLGGGVLLGALLNITVGVLSDRLRRKPFILFYETLTIGCALAAFFARHPALLAGAVVAAGFGRGPGGGAGPFSSAEQAWLAEGIAPENRGWIYSLNAGLGFFGMALGGLAAGLPHFWVSALGKAGSFRPLFLLVAAGSLLDIILLAGAEERYNPLGKTRRVPEHRGATPDARGPAPVAPKKGGKDHILWKLVGLNAFNGLAIGLTSPLISYWFALKFHVGPAAIGPVLAGTFALTGLASLFAGRMTRIIGVVNSVVWGRGAGVGLLILLPLMPVYILAALVYLLRSAVNRGTAGARQAMVISIVDEDQRGLAVSLNAASMQVPQAAGPAVAGALIGAGYFSLPFYFAAGLQTLYIVFYARVFRPYDTGGRKR